MTRQDDYQDRGDRDQKKGNLAGSLEEKTILYYLKG